MVFTGERPFRPAKATDVELLVGEFLAPAFQGLFDLVHWHTSYSEKSPATLFSGNRAARMMRGFKS
ncbi:hypothetical protein D3C80_1690630 [compost metagenome]